MIFKLQSNCSGLYVNNVTLRSNRSLNHNLNRDLNGSSLYINNGDVMQTAVVRAAAVWLGHKCRKLYTCTFFIGCTFIQLLFLILHCLCCLIFILFLLINHILLFTRIYSFITRLLGFFAVLFRYTGFCFDILSGCIIEISNIVFLPAYDRQKNMKSVLFLAKFLNTDSFKTYGINNNAEPLSRESNHAYNILSRYVTSTSTITLQWLRTLLHDTVKHFISNLRKLITDA